MYAELSAALTSVKAIVDIAKGFNALKQEADIKYATVALNGAIIEVQTHLMGLQQSLMKANEEKEKLLKRIRELEGGLEQKSVIDKYEKVTLPATGVLVYKLKTEHRIFGEPDHYACPTCLETEGKPITLQQRHDDEFLRCKVCNKTYQHTPIKPEQINTSSWLAGY